MSIFNTAGLMIGDPGNAQANIPFSEWRGLGYSFAAPQGCNGTTKNEIAGTLFDHNVSMLSYRDMIRGAGLKFVVWQKLYGRTDAEAEAEGNAFAEYLAWLRPDGAICNPENEYKDAPGRSRIYVDALIKRLGELGVALDSLEWCVQPLGGPSIPAGQDVSPWEYAYDMTPWLGLPGCYCAPEDYWSPTASGASDSFTPLNSTHEYVTRHGWPADRIAHTFGYWNPSFHSPADYAASEKLGWQRVGEVSPGFMLYLADQAPPDIIRAFGALASQGFTGEPHPENPTPAPPAVPGGTPEVPPLPVIPDPKVVNRKIAALADTWLGEFFGEKPLSRLRIIKRIATSSDAQWNAVREAVKAALDKEIA